LLLSVFYNKKVYIGLTLFRNVYLIEELRFILYPGNALLLNTTTNKNSIRLPLHSYIKHLNAVDNEVLTICLLSLTIFFLSSVYLLVLKVGTTLFFELSTLSLLKMHLKVDTEQVTVLKGSHLITHYNFASRTIKLNSRNTLIDEQSNPWILVQIQDVLSQHRGAEHSVWCELSLSTSLLSLTYLCFLGFLFSFTETVHYVRL